MKRLGPDLPETDLARVIACLADVAPRVLRAGWRIDDVNINALWFMHDSGLLVCMEPEFIDADLWLHVSFSRKTRDPDYADMARVKAVFIGADRKAIMVLPKQAEHVNLMPHCLHFYSPIDRDPRPDFRAANGGL